jgi:hypothetical protein
VTGFRRLWARAPRRTDAPSGDQKRDSGHASGRQVSADGEDADASDGSAEQVTEMLLVAGEQMATLRLDRSQKDRTVLCGKRDALWQGRRCGGFVSDLDLLNQLVQPSKSVRCIQVPLGLGDRVG